MHIYRFELVSDPTSTFATVPVIGEVLAECEEFPAAVLAMSPQGQVFQVIDLQTNVLGMPISTFGPSWDAEARSMTGRKVAKPSHLAVTQGQKQADGRWENRSLNRRAAKDKAVKSHGGEELRFHTSYSGEPLTYAVRGEGAQAFFRVLTAAVGKAMASKNEARSLEIV